MVQAGPSYVNAASSALVIITINPTVIQWEFQDPKMEVLYHIFGHIFWGYSLTWAWKIGLIYGIGTSHKSVPVAWPLSYCLELTNLTKRGVTQQGDQR